jgi:hypothetical protein
MISRQLVDLLQIFMLHRLWSLHQNCCCCRYQNPNFAKISFCKQMLMVTMKLLSLIPKT